jgi:uncharacterized protein (TIGR02646 family)
MKILATAKGGDWATPTAKKELKKALLRLTWGKCAFCEGMLESQAYTQIEHYVSRKVDPAGVFEWGNLFPSCQVCNTSKGHADHQGRLLKPDTEDPEPFFWITPEGSITPNPGLSEADRFRALETIRLCGLNRGKLRDDRQAVANFVRRWVERTAGLVDGLDHLLQEEWLALSDPRFNHKIVVRHVLIQKGMPGCAEADRTLFQRGK